MSYLKISIVAFSVFFLSGGSIFAQDQPQKIWISGAARSVLFGDDISIESTIPDTVTAKKLNSGHTLGDFNVNIRPNDNLYISAALRVRNDHGGFWGSGTSFDVRQLYMKGLIADAIRFQVGDINYKLTDYTFSNGQDFLSKHQIQAFEMNRNFIHQDMFYTEDNTWRQQGMAVDFGLNFNKLVEELTFDVFTFRLNPTNFGSTDDQFISGGVSQLKITDNIKLETAFTSTYEIEGTGNNSDFFKNNVGSGAIYYDHQLENWTLGFKGEMGTSLWQKKVIDEEIKLEDYFTDLSVGAMNKEKNIELTLGFRDVGPNFRSIGAQTQRINFERNPSAYTRYGNEQDIRNFGMYDLYRDVTLYNFQLSQNLDPYLAAYGNVNPYGKATPNRRLAYLDVSYTDLKERFNTSLGVNMGSEVIGQGTTTKRQFMSIDWKGLIDLSKIMSKEKSTQIEVGIWNEVTTRSIDAEFGDIDFTNMMLSAGLTTNVYADLDILLGWKNLNSSGNELINRRNDWGEIIGYSEMESERKESLISAGIQYRFNEKSKLNVLWNSFQLEDEKQEIIPFQVNSWSINYQIKF